MNTLDFSQQKLPFQLPTRFLKLIESKLTTDGLTTINLRDTTYSADAGGFRPVEIMVERKNTIAFLHYVTEFAYFGTGYCAELCKSADFDFANGVYCFGHTEPAPMADIYEFFELLSNNFCSYVDYEMLNEVVVTTESTYIEL